MLSSAHENAIKKVTYTMIAGINRHRLFLSFYDFGQFKILSLA